MPTQYVTIRMNGNQRFSFNIPSRNKTDCINNSLINQLIKEHKCCEKDFQEEYSRQNQDDLHSFIIRFGVNFLLILCFHLIQLMFLSRFLFLNILMGGCF